MMTTKSKAPATAITIIGIKYLSSSEVGVLPVPDVVAVVVVDASVFVVDAGYSLVDSTEPEVGVDCEVMTSPIEEFADVLVSTDPSSVVSTLPLPVVVGVVGCAVVLSSVIVAVVTFPVVVVGGVADVVSNESMLSTEMSSGRTVT